MQLLCVVVWFVWWGVSLCAAFFQEFRSNTLKPAMDCALKLVIVFTQLKQLGDGAINSQLSLFLQPGSAGV